MNTYRFIANRIRFKGKLPMICIAVSFLVMIIAVGVSSGFRREIRNGISAVSGDIQLLPLNRDFVSEATPIERHPAYLPHVDSLREVSAVVPVVYRVGIIKKGEDIHGVMFKGVPDRQDTVNLGVSIPRRLATILSIGEGDRLLTYFVGDNVRARNFTVTSVYDGIINTDDKLVVYASLEDMQRLNGWDEEQVSALEVAVKPAYRSTASLKQLEAQVGFLTNAYSDPEEESVYATSCVSSYPQMFDWLNLIDFNVLFILILMTIVAGFNMISGLLILLFENISTIGLLKALGMTDKGISRVFLTTSSSLVLKGMAIGNGLAIAFCLLENWLKLIPLDPVNYFVSYVPASLNIWLILAADIVAYLVIMLLMLIPSLFISHVDPARTVAQK